MPKRPQGQQRPADVIGNAVHVAKIATGEIEEISYKQPAKRKSGLAGGKARAASLDLEKEERDRERCSQGPIGRSLDMQNYPSHQIAIHITFEEMSDGRTYVTSPDLTGFHAVIDSDETPTDALREPLRLFLSHYLDAEIADIRAAMEPVSYRAHKVGIPLSDHEKPSLLWAAVA